MKQALGALVLVLGAILAQNSVLWALEAQKTASWQGVVIHISDSDHMTPEECDEWHRARGWDGCGYSFVVQKDGSIYEARGFSKIGAHTRWQNARLLGFCFVTKGCANKEQVEAFVSWLAQAEVMYGPLKVYPHKQFANKLCPGEV